MLETKEYPISELSTILGTSNKQTTDRKLKSYGIKFSGSGYGNRLVYSITEIPDPFRVFCVFDLGFAPQTNFDKLCEFLFFLLNDDDFNWRPLEAMEEYLRIVGHGMSRQTISKYVDRLRANGLCEYAGEYVYYRVYKYYGVQKHETVTKEEYSAAWRIYWNAKEKGYDSGAAYRSMYNVFHGTPRKQRRIEKNAFTLDTMDYLSKLVAERFNDRYGDDLDERASELNN